jgi:putative protease
MRLKLAKPELIAPAGDWDCVHAAVENGADAVYFGLERHNARMRAANFTLASLPGLMEFLHRRGVRGYVTFNTLVFADELPEAEDWLRGIIAAGADAAIVQDVGICRLIRRLSPDFPIHASTQMTVTSAAGFEFVRELGGNLVVLARECSIRDMEKIRSELSAKDRDGSAGPEFPIEVFVHGALCVAYSGQCLTSESLGGRSANRGVCAQACRMPYELIADGQLVPLGDRRYLLSPRDLSGLEVLPDLVLAGVASLKIEGRLKSPEYVANITRIYRNALDRIGDLLNGASEPTPEMRERLRDLAVRMAEETRYDMEMAFSRGLHTGWLQGTNNQELVHGRFGKKRGVFLGTVTRVNGSAIFIEMRNPVKPGDGVVFDAGRPDEDEEGGRVYEARPAGREHRLEFGRGDLDFTRIHTGDKVWKTSDPELERRLRQTFAGEQPRFQRPLTLEISGRAGQPLSMLVQDELGHVFRIESNLPLERAAKWPLSGERLREQLGRLGGTPYKLGELHNLLDGEVILPVSELNRLRREAVIRLDDLRARPPAWTLVDRPSESLLSEPAGTGSIDAEIADLPHASHPAELLVLVRSMAQLEGALQSGITTIYCEFEDPKKYRDAVARFRAWQAQSPCGGEAGLWVAPPRVFRPGEEWILRLVRSSGADGYLVRNYDHLKYFSESRCIGDYSLNIANALSAEHFIRRYGLERVTASYDLNVEQLESLLKTAPPLWFEVTIHQHMPMFHMEHCTYCAFLSEGTDYTNCGRPCDTREVKLRDRMGADHYLKADAGCRNTVFNALAQTGAEAVPRLLNAGVRYFRVEFMDDSVEQTVHLIDRYRQLLRGEISGTQVWKQLKLQNRLGVTRGPSLA